jgi:hypothetical protein
MFTDIAMKDIKDQIRIGGRKAYGQSKERLARASNYRVRKQAEAIMKISTAFLADQIIASLDATVDADAETEWHNVIARRSREMEEDRIDARPEEEMIRDIRAKLDAARHKAS